MLIFGLLVIWFLSRAQKKIIGVKLKEQALELTLQKELLINTVKTQEEERERISKELHDDVSSQLNIIHLNVHLLKEKLEGQSDFATIIDHIDKSLQNSTQRARSISHELMPAMLKKFGLTYTLDELANSINLTEKINIKIEGMQFIKIKDNFNLLHIYRILQELINNTLKYAQANKISILFSEEPDNLLKIQCQDNGIGFDSEIPTEGLGMGNIRTRIKLLNGDIHFDSPDTGGFFATLNIPNYEEV